MKMKNIHVARDIILRTIVLITAVPLCGCRTWAVSVHRDIDVNSGVVRQRTFFLALPVGTQVSETPFSREIRRLQIPTAQERVWKAMTVSTGKRVATREYAGAIEDCDFLVQLLNIGKVLDQDRHAILMTALSNLQLGRLEETCDLLFEVGEQVRAEYGFPLVPGEPGKRVIRRGDQPWRIHWGQSPNGGPLRFQAPVFRICWRSVARMAEVTHKDEFSAVFAVRTRTTGLNVCDHRHGCFLRANPSVARHSVTVPNIGPNTHLSAWPWLRHGESLRSHQY